MSTGRFIDLFAGCGGMSLGFERAGFESALAIDFWADALQTYQYNRPEAQILCADLESLDPETIKQSYKLEGIDLIIGGPPCQGFSLAGKRIIEDKRNALYRSFVRFVATFRPKAFVMENVPNILSMGNGVIRDQILSDFRALGYTVSYKVLLASDYGVPQNRRRAFFVGLASGAHFEFPEPLATAPITSFEALSDLGEDSQEDGSAYLRAAGSDYQHLMREGSSGVFNHQASKHNAQTIETIAQVPDGGNYKDLPAELQGIRRVHIAWTRLNSQRPSFTIDTGHNHHFHYSYNRVPTVRESARLQSFPDNFVFCCAKTSQLRQVGNAVPPILAEAVAEAVKKQIK